MDWRKDSTLAHCLLILFALGLMIWGIVNFQMSGGGMKQIFALLILGGCGAVSGCILAPYIGRFAGGLIGDAIYFKRDKLKRAPERLDHMKGLVEAGRYDEAATELRTVLARDFMDIEARMLLIRVYREALGDEADALEICPEFFDHPGHVSNHDTLDMLLYLSDVLPSAEALEYLRRELKRGRYSTYDKRILQNRLESLS